MRDLTNVEINSVFGGVLNKTFVLTGKSSSGEDVSYAINIKTDSNDQELNHIMSSFFQGVLEFAVVLGNPEARKCFWEEMKKLLPQKLSVVANI